MTGRFIAIVGPSGVGKDSVMEALAATDPAYVLARRVIKRPGDAGGEDFEGVTDEEFSARVAADAFALHWDAHGLRYGIPAEVDQDLAQGRDVLANLSRAVLPAAQKRFDRLIVIVLTVSREMLAQRLAARNRETPQDIVRRLERAEFAMPPVIRTFTVDNSYALGQTVTAIQSHLSAETPAQRPFNSEKNP